MKNIDRNSFLFQLTVHEFLELLSSLKEEQESNLSLDAASGTTEYVYGISGLARVLGCSKSHAGKLKNSGIFNDAIIQNGRKIIIDKEKVIRLFNAQKKS